MQIEPATIGQLDRVTDLWLALARGQQEFGSNLRVDVNRDRIKQEIAHHIVHQQLLVAVDDTGVWGFVSFLIEQGMYEKVVTRGIIQNLYVEPEVRGDGVGSALIDAAENALVAMGAEVIAIESLADNTMARELYQELGYELHRVEYERVVDSDEE